MKRYCKVFYCGLQGDKICCATCRDRRDCADPCLNHPSRCKLENVKRRSSDSGPEVSQ